MEIEALTAGVADAPEIDLSRLSVRTQEYYAAILRSPQAAVYQPTDWMRVRDLLTLKDLFYRNEGDPVLILKLAAEIRQLEDRLLFGQKERASAGVRVKPPMKAEEPEESEPDPFAGMD
ncbi:hypothetical protein ACFFH7_36485 [Kutzneria chonburiensis]|uniref:Terminase small subunit n=1 Tax=Kutzneria chonburiensis TaxID=1483604 RepID=A0ABV6N381_9PSEU|nr:hypothetical protein [Kutzneria chonburiensis]